MPWRAANSVPIGTGYVPQAVVRWPYQHGATRLDVFVNFTDAVVQFGESYGTEAFQDDQTEEILCREGFNSIPAEEPFYIVRFRVWPSTQLAQSGTVDVRMTGPR